MINSFNTVLLTVTFLMPGFIIFYIKSMLVPQRIVHQSNYIFRYFFYSSINIAISMPLIYFVQSNNYYESHPYKVILFWISIVIILPIVLGIVFANISSRGIDKKILNKICPSTLGSIPTAWDYKFSKLDEERYVQVKLKDGSIIRGLYSTESYVSSQQEERDIYLEELFYINENNSWINIENSDGVLLKSSEIVAIEFIKIEDDCEKNFQVLTIEMLKDLQNQISKINGN
ncbi:hypothetical protein JGS6364_PCS1200511 (plasmid) [[Clostridium] sordellii]|uniref:DUF6338 family protein n=1 Tax=Paraclostridium sordellii TaxID=1505 RepID=UPI000541042A|nr:DUF6338 family protein [Paeniclostridium sordellii]CEK32660.1 hypothetical protein JGS6364_PCS1200511 (plasmid) [[Clostridium] sordellii] [Paeniclostridium sordellii]